MIEPKKEEYYLLDCFESHFDPAKLSLDGLATQFFGRQYKGQQAGEMIPNDTVKEYDFSGDDESWWGYEDFHVNQLEAWLAEDPKDYEYDFELYRKAPEPDTIIAHLILNEVLPRGRYLLRVSW